MTAQQYFLDIKTKALKAAMEELPSLYVIGLDCSLTSTGFAVVKNGRYVYGCEIGCKYYGAERLKDITTQIIRKIESYPAPRLILIEGYAYGVSPAQSRNIVSLGELGGTLRTFLFMRNIPFLTVASTTIKKFVVGKGNAPKTLVPMHILKKFKITPIGGDHADAVGIAFFGHTALRFANTGANGYTNKEIECFEMWLSLKPKEKKKKRTTRTLALEINE